MTETARIENWTPLVVHSMGIIVLIRKNLEQGGDHVGLGALYDRQREREIRGWGIIWSYLLESCEHFVFTG